MGTSLGVTFIRAMVFSGLHRGRPTGELPVFWVSVQELKLSYYNTETLLYTHITVTYFKFLNSNPANLSAGAYIGSKLSLQSKL